MDSGLKKVIADTVKHKTRLRQYISSANKDLKKAQGRLKNFELLAKDPMFGKYYVGYVRDESATIKRLQQYVSRCQSRLVQIAKNILALRQLSLKKGA
jgi:hypothetical protein